MAKTWFPSVIPASVFGCYPKSKNRLRDVVPDFSIHTVYTPPQGTAPLGLLFGSGTGPAPLGPDEADLADALNSDDEVGAINTFPTLH